MGITVQHSPSPLTVGYAALYAGQGQRAERDADRRQRESMQMRQLAAQKASQDAAQEFQAKMAEQQFERQKEYDAQKFERDILKDTQNFEQQMEFSYGDKAAQFKQTIAQNEFDYKKQLQEYELTEKEKIENSRIQDRISWVEDQVRQGTWTEEEGAQAIAQLQGIRKPPKIPKTTIQDQVKSDIWKDPDTGIMWNRKPDGGLEPVHPPKGAELGDVAKLYEGALKALKRVNPETDEEIPPTQAEIDQYIERVMALRQRITGSGTGQPAPAPQIQIPSAGEAMLGPEAAYQRPGGANTMIGDPSVDTGLPQPRAMPANMPGMTLFSSPQIAAMIKSGELNPMAAQYLQSKGAEAIVTNEAEYNDLPVGTKYVGPDGRLYTKTR